MDPGGGLDKAVATFIEKGFNNYFANTFNKTVILYCCLKLK